MTASQTSSETGPLLEHLFRHSAGRMVAHLARLLGPAHLDLAEETVQEAMLKALQTWPYHGVPKNAAAWLFRAAHNLAIDSIRRRQTFGKKTEAIAAELSCAACVQPQDPDWEEQLRDDELRMIFMCCHPEIPHDSRVALSLKTAAGFSVREIGRAFLSEDSTIAQRLVRAKRCIRERNLTLDMPAGPDLAARLDSVLEVLYFLFNEGYTAHSGEDLIRVDLCHEALRLSRLVASSSIATPRAHALTALMAFQAARLAARVDESGDLVLLEDQNRALWDQRLLRLGLTHFNESMVGDEASEFHTQAAIALTHARAADARSTDWAVIFHLYDQLFSIHPSPVVELNRAVALSKLRGPEAALEAIAPLEKDPNLRGYYLLLAVRGHLLHALGRMEEAEECFREALKRPCSEPERRFLRHMIERCRRPCESEPRSLPE